jgi:quercetin dioxygenase-like cupin family protein
VAWVARSEDAPAQAAAPGVTMRLLIGPQQGAPFFNMRLFAVEPGASTPRHSHWWEHEVYVLSGEGVLSFPGGELPIRAGAVAFVPGGEEHAFRNTGAQPLLFLCLVPQEWLEGQRPPHQAGAQGCREG